MCSGGLAMNSNAPNRTAIDSYHYKYSRRKQNHRPNRNSLDETVEEPNVEVAVGGQTHRSKLPGQMTSRQTTVEELPKKAENGHVFSFSLQTSDRSYSEPLIFPPIGGRKIAPIKRPSHLYTNNKQGKVESEKVQNEPSKPVNIKFPIVSKQELYKHLGIPTEGTVYRRVKEANKRISRAPTRNTNTPQLQPLIPPFHSQTDDRNTMGYQRLDLYKKWHDDQKGRRRGLVPPVKLLTDESFPRPVRHLERMKLDERVDQNGHSTDTKPGVDKEHLGQGNPEVALPSSRAESPPAPVPEELLNRQYSISSWHTWRHKDQSYAYDNVQAYITENELMDDEKEAWIKQWLKEVDEALATHPPTAQNS